MSSFLWGVADIVRGVGKSVSAVVHHMAAAPLSQYAEQPQYQAHLSEMKPSATEKKLPHKQIKIGTNIDQEPYAHILDGCIDVDEQTKYHIHWCENALSDQVQQ